MYHLNELGTFLYRRIRFADTFGPSPDIKDVRTVRPYLGRVSQEHDRPVFDLQFHYIWLIPGFLADLSDMSIQVMVLGTIPC